MGEYLYGGVVLGKLVDDVVVDVVGGISYEDGYGMYFEWLGWEYICYVIDLNL